VPHTQAAYAGASSGNPTSASLPLALDSFIPPLGLVDPAAPHLLPQPQEGPSEPAAKRQKQVHLCSGCGFSLSEVAHKRAARGSNCHKNCRWCRKPWHAHDGDKRGTRCLFSPSVAGGGGGGGG